MTAPAMDRRAIGPVGDAPTAFTFSVPRSALLEALARVGGSTKASKLMPVLHCVLIDAAPGSLTFSTTDLERWVMTSLPLSAVTGKGSIALPVDKLSKIVATLPAGSVTIDIKGTKAKITSGRTKFDILGLSPTEFPAAIRFTAALSRTVEGRAFTVALARVAAHVGGEGREARLQGAYLEATDEGLALVCSDGNGMARAMVDEKVPDPAESSDAVESFGIIIPRDVFSLVSKLFADDDALRIDASDAQVQFVGARSTLTSRIIEGPYPPYRRVLALPAAMTVVAKRAELMAAVERCALVAEHDQVGMRFGADGIALSGFSNGDGEAEDFVDATRTIHSAADVGRGRLFLAGDYLRASLKAVPCDDVAIELHGDALPVYIRDATPAAKGLKSIAAQMPMRVTDPRDANTDTGGATDA